MQTMPGDLSTVKDRPGIDDPIWELLLISKLTPYIERARAWWELADRITFEDTGIYDSGDGLYIRFTRVAARSPIKGIQAFPFIPTGRLQLSNIEGGSTKMVQRLCLDRKLHIDEFTIISKSNLPSTFNAAQIVCFVPTELLDNRNIGCWLYFTQEELAMLAMGRVNEAIRTKAVLKA